MSRDLKSIVVENRAAPFVTAQLGLRAGAWTETKPGTAAMALGMVTRGTTQHSPAGLAYTLEAYALSLYGHVGMDHSRVSANCLSEFSHRAVQHLAEVVRNPTFPDSEFEQLHQRIHTELTDGMNEPEYLADREFRHRIYGQHPYARAETGEIEDIDALTVEDVRGWWQRFVRPDMATLILAGDIDRQQALVLAETHFGDWSAEGPLPQAELPPIPKPKPTHIYLVDHPSRLSHIRIGQLGINLKHPRYCTSCVVNAYFGSTFSSRLNHNIRVSRKLAHGACGAYRAQHLAGVFEVNTFCRTERAAEMIQAILEEIRRLRTQPPSTDELHKVKSRAAREMSTQRPTPQQIAEERWLAEVQELPSDYQQRLREKVNTTTAEDCIRLVRETIDPATMVIVVAGPAETLPAELERIAPVTVVHPQTSADVVGVA